MPTVLNPLLYARLDRAMGPVRISNAGEAMIAVEGESVFVRDSDRATEFRPRLEILHDGEYYLVNCPYCRDTRQRLYVNHMYGKNSNGGRRMRFLAICFNEACMKKEEVRDDFITRLSVTDEMLEQAPVVRGRVVTGEVAEARMPGPCRLLSELDDRHPARVYVRARRFDPDRLARAYGVSYCEDSIHWLARGRLVVPIRWDGRLVGWQTRHIGELPWKGGGRSSYLPPKYWTMPNMPRSTILPNLENAMLFRTGVIVEGWFDVFGFGPMAVPVLGCSLSDRQIRLFATAFGRPGRSGVFLLDPEEIDKPTTQRIIRILRHRLSGQLAVVRLPAGTDPGKLDRAFLRNYVREQAEDQDVQVSWERAS